VTRRNPRSPFRVGAPHDLRASRCALGSHKRCSWPFVFIITPRIAPVTVSSRVSPRAIAPRRGPHADPNCGYLYLCLTNVRCCGTAEFQSALHLQRVRSTLGTPSSPQTESTTSDRDTVGELVIKDSRCSPALLRHTANRCGTGSAGSFDQLSGNRRADTPRLYHRLQSRAGPEGTAMTRTRSSSTRTRHPHERVNRDALPRSPGTLMVQQIRQARTARPAVSTTARAPAIRKILDHCLGDAPCTYVELVASLRVS
jgi:hypothetical protein